MLKFFARKLPHMEEGISEVYFSVDDKFFPAVGWTDFDRAIKTWAKGIGPNGTNGNMFFMDGPYNFFIKRLNIMTYEIKFMKKYEDKYASALSYVATKDEFDNIVRSIRDYSTKL